MAQTGYTPIQLYRTATASTTPSAGNLADGELAINTNDGRLFYKDNTGVVQIIASKTGASGDVVGPASATDNAIARFDLTTGKIIQNSGVTIDDNNNLTLPSQSDLRFADSDSSNWVAFQAAPTVTSNVTWTLPASDGSANQVLTTNGSGTLSWSSPAGGVTSITGTSNQIIASASTGAVTLSTPQSIGTSSSVQFGSFGVGTGASGTTGEIRATNNVTAYFSSDANLKENIKDIENALNAVNFVGGKTFDWKDDYIENHGGIDGYFVNKKDFGVIAQDLQKVFPIAVKTRQDGTLAVDYEKLVALAFAAIKELAARLELLETK